jgi:hypothetical protein
MLELPDQGLFQQLKPGSVFCRSAARLYKLRKNSFRNLQLPVLKGHN